MLSAILPFAWPIYASLFGLVIGSFANVCVHRLPARQSVVTPRSYCPRCRQPIAAWDNVPVLSYLILRGRCRHCRAPISLRYPLVEATNGALYFALAMIFPPSPRTAVLMVFATALLILSLIDLEHQILPDAITLPGIVLGLLTSLLPGGPTPFSACASALGGYLMFMWIAKAWQVMRGIDALGQGDWKLAAMLGAFLGWEKLLLTIFLAALAGALVGTALVLVKGRSFQQRLPFGTFLGVAGIVALAAGEPVVFWYRGFLEV